MKLNIEAPINLIAINCFIDSECTGCTGYIGKLMFMFLIIKSLYIIIVEIRK